MNATRFGPLFILVLLVGPALWAKHRQQTDTIVVDMQNDPAHSMIAIDCQINGHHYSCVIDSGATFTLISDKVLKAEGPLVDVTTAHGVIRVHQREVSLRIAGNLEMKSKAFVESNMTPDDVEILVGEDVLRQFRAVIFDYANQQVQFHR